eukprot:GHVU01008137.1.p2 GENE.GHVU01008137.1~~GHVU01008137.1.p2  ORF type:complete len:180 (+),score=15.31 GHVU01008137.1:331-870(+)
MSQGRSAVMSALGRVGGCVSVCWSCRRRVLSIEVRSDVDEMGGRISSSAAATATVGGEEDTPPPPPPSRLPRGRNCITEITIKGYAFLWQQVRCMVGVLALIGAGHDCAETIDRLLDIEAYPRKPVDSLRKACEPEQNPLKAMQGCLAESQLWCEDDGTDDMDICCRRAATQKHFSSAP